MSHDAKAPHSAAVLNDSRDHWWSEAQLQRFSRDVGLDRCARVLDAGCGLGHFGRLLAPYLAQPFSLVGIDREETWVRGATERAAPFLEARGLQGALTYGVGSVEALPFPDHAFDAVVCQTLLMHVPDPAAVLREFTRVVRPGGLVLVAEPNNLGGLQRLANGASATRDPDELGREVATFVRFTRGKQACGEGDQHLGARLPALLSGLRGVQYCTCERPFVLTPPYETEAERTMLEVMRADVAAGLWCWPRPEAKRYWLAGGGADEAFDAAYEQMLGVERAELARIDAGLHTELTAVAHFLAAGRTPA